MSIHFPVDGTPVDFRSSAWFITLVVSYSELVDALLYTIVLPVVPFTLSERACVPQEKVAIWNSFLISVYGVGAAFLSAPMGYWVGKCSSKKFPFLVALINQLAATLLMWFGNSLALQVISRIFLGASASLVYISGSVILVEQAGTEHVAENMGWISTALSMGSFFGPLLGGAILAKFGYDAVFGLMTGFVALDILLRLLMKENPEAGGLNETSYKMTSKSDSHFEQNVDDYSYMRLGAVSPTEKEYQEPPQPWKTYEFEPTQTQSFRVPEVIRLCASPRMCMALFNIFTAEIILSGLEAVLAVFVEDLWGWDSLGAGMIYLPVMIPSVGSPLIGRLADRVGTRWPVLAGFLIMCPLLILMQFINQDTVEQKAVFFILLLFIGLGIDLAMDPLLGEVCRIVEEAEESRRGVDGRSGLCAQAYGIFNAVWHIGYVIGPLWAGLVRDLVGWSAMSWSLGLLSGFIALIQILEWKRPWISRQQRSRV
ncbi:MFS general substrate transporter [Thozetella sp. PMI_491]|nr:MFS general substrate transporter [Thozetella sp. PMI_491]